MTRPPVLTLCCVCLNFFHFERNVLVIISRSAPSRYDTKAKAASENTHLVIRNTKHKTGERCCDVQADERPVRQVAFVGSYLTSRKAPQYVDRAGHKRDRPTTAEKTDRRHGGKEKRKCARWTLSLASSTTEKTRAARR